MNGAVSYGVNLQISDVALLNVMFPENERIPSGRPESILLSRCDFVNMAGRSGRLGQFTAKRNPTVHWYLDPEQERAFESVIRAFYTGQVWDALDATEANVGECLLLAEAV